MLLSLSRLKVDRGTSIEHENKLLSIIAFVQLLAVPLDCTGGALGLRATLIENHWTRTIFRIIIQWACSTRAVPTCLIFFLSPASVAFASYYQD